MSILTASLQRIAAERALGSSAPVPAEVLIAPAPSALMVARFDPARLPENFFYANGVDADGGLLSWALTGGEVLGLDNNYKFALYRDGHVEFAYLLPDLTGEATRDTYLSASELTARGVNVAGAPRDSHGVPQPSGYPAASNPKPGPGGLGDFLGYLGFTFLTLGFGSAVAAAGAAAEAGAVTTGYEGLAQSGLEISSGGVATESYLAAYSSPLLTPEAFDAVTVAAEAPSSVEVLGAPAAAAPSAPVMPAAVPEVDPTFGGALTETAPGVYTSTETALGGSGVVQSAISTATSAAKGAVANAIRQALQPAKSPLQKPAQSNTSPAASGEAVSADGVVTLILLGLGAFAFTR